MTNIDLVRKLKSKSTFWLEVGALYDGTCAPPLSSAHIVYSHQEILYVGKERPPLDVLKNQEQKPDLVLPNWTLIPGLIEAHAHIFLEGGEEDPEKRALYLKRDPEALYQSAVIRMNRLPEVGVVGVRDAGDRNGVGLRIQSERESRGSAWPYFESPGPAIHHQGRYGSFMATPMETDGSPEACVESRIREGARRVKLLATGIINFEKGAVTAKPQMPVEELQRFVRHAHAHQKQTFAHASGDDGIENCLQAGVDTIEHGFFVREDQLKRMRDQNIAWVPTFAPVQFQVDAASKLGWSDLIRGNLQKILETHALRLRQASEWGVKIIAGSDAGSHGVPHGWGLIKELELMQAAGMGAKDVLRSATGSASERLYLNEPFGILKKGYRPRFILTPENPLQDVALLRRPKIVVMDGTVVDSTENKEPAGF